MAAHVPRILLLLLLLRIKLCAPHLCDYDFGNCTFLGGLGLQFDLMHMRKEQFYCLMQISSEVNTNKDLQMSVREALTSKRDRFERELENNLSDSHGLSDDDNDDGDEAKFDARMRIKILKKRRELGEVSSQSNGTFI